MDNAWIVHEIKYQKFKRDSKNLGNNLKKNIKIHSYEKDCPALMEAASFCAGVRRKRYSAQQDTSDSD